MDFSFDRFYQINRKAIIWVVLFGLIYILRRFFTLIFLTFIIGYFAIPLAARLKERLKLTRGFSIALVYGLFFISYIGICVVVIPSAVRQVAGMQGRLPSIKASLFKLRDDYTEKHRGAAKILGIYAEPSLLRSEDLLRSPQKFFQKLAADIELPAQNPSKRVMEMLPGETRAKILELAAAPNPSEPPGPLIFSEESEAEDRIIQDINERVLRRPEFFLSWYFDRIDLTRNPKITELVQRNRADLLEREAQRLNRLLLEAAYPEFIAKSQVAEDELEARLDEALRSLQIQMPKFASLALEFFLTSVLAILFSFLVAFDLGRLSREVRSLAGSKLSDFYEEAAQPVIRFALSVGYSFQSAVVMSLIITLMNVVSLFIMRIPSVTLLGVITFLASLVPVAGAPIHTAAIMLVALNEKGESAAIIAGVAAIVIQIVARYLIGPRLIGGKMKLNLAAVLCILFIGYKVGGMWGVVLGGPVAGCILRDIFKVPFLEDKDDAPEPPPAAALAGPGAQLPDDTLPR